jgi:hypothetical protein
MIYAIFYLLYRLNLKACIDNINSRAHMIAPMAKPVICEELTWKDVDKLTKSMKRAIIPTKACEQPSLHLLLAVNIIDCSEVAKRISQRIGVPVTLDKIVDLIATTLVKFLIVIVFVEKKFGEGERTI